ncbi:GyrI-like domain-containing protein [Salirhabdus sp. Marseille-P4669]|uniref:GyrI-like domain-containing protein n=1 Tax=Salirhabdus sp. Marseille-P4669 TaxID=2042310 RepID=UPI000C7E7514|nr:GyrI-like domain-containing protein [Salirhabdus sp. Marseille-P4669]
MEIEVVTKPSFQAIGLAWEGTFEQAGAGEIREIMKTLQNTLHDIKQVVHPDVHLGISNHENPSSNRFKHYSVVEVEGNSEAPEGMVKIQIPTLRYVKTHHKRGDNIQETYTKIYNWIKENGYELDTTFLTHYEAYPMNESAYSHDPEFTIMIPVK